MKLRFQFNSIRLRLKRSEVDQLARAGRVEEKIIWGQGATFLYVLETSTGVTSPQSHLTADGLVVQVPSELVTIWANSDQVGIRGREATGNEVPLQVLIEKDFACLDRTGEENFDTFPNPLANTTR